MKLPPHIQAAVEKGPQLVDIILAGEVVGQRYETEQEFVTRIALMVAEDCARKRDKVPVLPDTMPDEIFEAIQDRDTAEEALRILVRQTLDEYEQAIRAAYGLKP